MLIIDLWPGSNQTLFKCNSRRHEDTKPNLAFFMFSRLRGDVSWSTLAIVSAESF